MTDMTYWPGWTGLADVGLLLLRLVVGGLLMGHGSQKLFGWFGGHALEGTGGWLESMGMHPGKFWATMAGSGEFFGGALLVLGFLHPLGSIAVMAVMTMAWIKAHAGKPIWSTEGGAELPLTNMAVALAVALTGPGFLSLDYLAGLFVPAAVIVLAIVAAVAGVLAGAFMRPAEKPGLREVPRQEEREAAEDERAAA
jgi:putative oxidoreductase